MVLTAGLGTRLRPLSLVRAKPAVPVAGVPLAGRILRWLAAAGVRNAVLNLHHRPETVTSAIGDGAAFGVHVRYSWEPAVLGSAGGPARALPLLGAPRFWLVNGDTITTVDLAAMAAQHAARGARVTIALVPNPDPLHYGGVEVSPDGAVTGFTPRGPANRGWHFVGVQLAEAAVFSSLDPDTPSETFRGRYPRLFAEEPGAVQAFLCNAAFHDIGTAADYLATSLAFAEAEGAPLSLRGEGCEVDPTARLARSIIWDRVAVGPGAVLDECVVADGVSVPAGAVLSRQVLVRRDDRTPGDGESVLGTALVAPLDAHRRKDR
jgi:NDP-sugar pyrophosphorylase family protein